MPRGQGSVAGLMGAAGAAGGLEAYLARQLEMQKQAEIERSARSHEAMIQQQLQQQQAQHQASLEATKMDRADRLAEQKVRDEQLATSRADTLKFQRANQALGVPIGADVTPEQYQYNTKDLGIDPSYYDKNQQPPDPREKDPNFQGPVQVIPPGYRFRGKEADILKGNIASAQQSGLDIRDLRDNLNKLTIAQIAAGAKGASGDTSRMDKSYQNSVKELNDLRKPIADQLERVSRFQDSISQMTPQADSVLAPEVMIIMAGGQGSGVRITNAEIDRVMGGRSNIEDLKARINKWRSDPRKALSVTPAQRLQMRDLVAGIAKRGQQKLEAVTQAHQDLIDSPDVTSHRQIVQRARQALNTITGSSDMGAQSGTLRARDPQGTLHEAPAGTPLPQGWKLEP